MGVQGLFIISLETTVIKTKFLYEGVYQEAAKQKTRKDNFGNLSTQTLALLETNFTYAIDLLWLSGLWLNTVFKNYLISVHFYIDSYLRQFWSHHIHSHQSFIQFTESLDSSISMNITFELLRYSDFSSHVFLTPSSNLLKSLPLYLLT